MTLWIDDLRDALADFDRPGKTLGSALDSPGATPSELGMAVRSIFGQSTPGIRPADLAEAAGRWAAKLEGAAIGLKDGLVAKFWELEQRIATELRGSLDAQQAAGLVLACEFRKFGRSVTGLILADPWGTIWEKTFPPDDLFEGRWLVLGWPRGDGPRPIYQIADVQRYTAQLEAERREAQAAHDAEQQRMQEVDQIAFARSPAGRIAALEAEIAKLRADRPAA